MDYLCFSNHCIALMKLSSMNFMFREKYYVMKKLDPNSRFEQFFETLAQSFAAGLLMGTIRSVSQKSFNLNGKITLIPIALALTTSGLAYIARKTNTFADEMENVEKYLAIAFDVTVCVCSVAYLVLLAPHAKRSPVGFGLALFNVALNVGHGFYHNLYCLEEGIQQQIGHRET